MVERGGGREQVGLDQDATTRMRIAALGERVRFSTGMARPTRRALAVAADPEILTALGARLSGDSSSPAIWLRAAPVGDDVYLVATRAFFHDGEMATASLGAPLGGGRASNRARRMLAALDLAVRDPEAWVDDHAEAPLPEANPFSGDAVAQAIGRMMGAETRPAIWNGATSWTFWESVAALYDRTPAGWRPALSAAFGFASPPRAALLAGRAAGETEGGGEAEQMLVGPETAARALAALGTAPSALALARDPGAAADLFRRRLALAEQAPAWPRAALAAFLTDFDAPAPTAPTRNRTRTQYLGAIAGAIEERAVDGAPAAPFGIARAVGLAAFDVSPEAWAAWRALGRAQPSLGDWAALMMDRFDPLAASAVTEAPPIDAIADLRSLRKLHALDGELRQALAAGATTPLDSPAFAARLGELAARGARLLAEAPQALVSQELDGRWRAAAWTAVRADLFADLPRRDRDRVADRLADIERAVALEAVEKSARAAWREAIGRLRENSALEAQQQSPAFAGQSLLEALGEAAAAGSTDAASFWRRAFDSWVEQQQTRSDVDLAGLLQRMADKLSDRPGAAMARRAALLAHGRVATKREGAEPIEPMTPPPPPEDDPSAAHGAERRPQVLGRGVSDLLGEIAAAKTVQAEPEEAPIPSRPRGARDDDFDDGAGADLEEDLEDDREPREDRRESEEQESDSRRDMARRIAALRRDEDGAERAAPRADERLDEADLDEEGSDDEGLDDEELDDADVDEDELENAPGDAAVGDSDEPEDQAVERPRRLGEGLDRVRADIEGGLGVERSSERELVRQADPALLDIQDALRHVRMWQRSFREEYERRLSEGRQGLWSLTAAAGSAREAVAQIRHLADVVREHGKRASATLPLEIVWSVRQFTDLELDPKSRPRPEPAPRGLRRAWAALAEEPTAEEPASDALFYLALATEWLTLEGDSRAKPMVRFFEIALSGDAPQMVQSEGGRVAEIGPRTLADYIYEPPGRDGFDSLDKVALLARLDRLMFFLSLLDWRLQAPPAEKRQRLMRFWRPAFVVDLVAQRETGDDRDERRDDALSAIDAPPAFIDALRGSGALRVGDAETESYAAMYCAIFDRTSFPSVGQLGLLRKVFGRDILGRA